ncbi:MAG: hypothetical protein DSM106950_05650 [Stigonema ocellatum SAG 48.90 = DSM 106950]|nr:hypothetical protein [Stigonema ocellatum SAG 48.90 = DSM 106950]
MRISMIPRLSTTWLVPLALTIVSVCSSAARTTAQTIYPFAGNYSTTVTITPITDNVSQVVERGDSLDAPYGLNQYNGLTYSRTDTNGNLSFNNDPAAFGIQGYQFGYLTFGSDTNKVLGFGDGNASVDLENQTSKGSGIVNITDGEGIFTNAGGTLFYSENDQVTLGSTIILKGQALVTGSIQVPEPGNTATLVGIGALGAGLLLRQRRLKSV